MRKRKLAVVVLTLVGVFALAAVAYAFNTYTVTPASTTPAGAGSAGKPKPKKVRFGFRTGSTDATIPAPITKYKINFQGLKYFGKAVKKCKFSDANGSNYRSKCRKAKLGSGTVNNFFGAAGTPLATANHCRLALTLYNLGNGFALRLDGVPPGCPISLHQAIKAKFKTVRVGGIKSASVQFSVPLNLRHPAPSVNNSVSEVSATVLRKTKRLRVHGRKRKVGVLSSVACKRGQRTIQVQFTDESGKTTAATKTIRC
jgi:hypothetical protein